jgi:hypothetical protein
MLLLDRFVTTKINFMKTKIIIFSLFLLFSLCAIAQDNITHKEYKIIKVEKSPSIDGVLDDQAWQNANIATNFVMFRPRSNEPEPDNIKTEVRIVYDDKAIYFGAYLHDDKVDEIPMEFQTRDNFGNADFFGVVLNPLNDGQNQTEFFVMSTGNQNDALVTPSNGEDFSWNAVWDSAVKVVDDGWIVEMKIPYSALRFSNDNVQTWGLNFHRQHRKNRDQYTWNFIDRENGNIAQYDGIITGIKNITPPIRLSFNPFVTGITNTFAGDTEFNWSAGLDVKYGLTENFTLDATLIPDFGQVAFDDVELNLGPFEQQFSEQRAFFTEGTDLFNKGNLFFSRRIGNSPTGVELEENEEFSDFPSKVDVLNIVKISGRTKNGLGIGFLNAITEKTEASTIKTEIDEFGNEVIINRDVVVEPLANYNVLVLDQQFNKNSSVSLVNTNVTRDGHFRDANVTALVYNVKTKDSKYGISGSNSVSNIFLGNGLNPVTGLQGNIRVGKNTGNHQYSTGFSFTNERFDKNDLGFQRRNNIMSVRANYSYRIFEPKGIFNNYGIFFFGNSRYRLELNEQAVAFQERSKKYTGNNVGFSAFANTKKQLSFGANVNTNIGSQYNYFEPRVLDRFYKESPSFGVNQWISTDFSKRFSINANYFIGLRYDESRSFFNFEIEPRFRVNNKFSIIYGFDYSTAKNQKGYVNIDENDNIIFGNRDFVDIENTVSAKFNFNTKSAIALSIRYLWSPNDYDDQYFTLQNNGELTENNDYNQNHDLNFNIWNLDLNFNWEFAPGSQLVALYRNQIFNENDQAQLNFTDNLEDLFNEDILHNFSIKLIYYLDYNQLKTLL